MKVKHQPTAIKMDEVSTIIFPIEWGFGAIFGVIILLILMWGIFGQISHRVDVLGVVGIEGSQSFLIDAPTGGFMGSTHVKKGDLVEIGTPLVEIISLKKPLENKETIFDYHKILSPIKGRVSDIFVKSGRHLSKNQQLLRLQTPGRRPEVHFYFSVRTYKQIKAGQEVLVKLNHAEHVKTLTGVVQHISQAPINRDSTFLPKALLPKDPVYKGTITLYQKFLPHSKEKGFTWPVSTGKEVFISVGNLVQTSILIKKQKPIAMILPFFN